MTAIDTDLLVLGAGAAGLVTALAATGRRVCLLNAADSEGHPKTDAGSLALS